jgi:hypothetical protein
MVVEELALDGAEEAFDQGVVQALPGSSVRQDDAVVLGQGAYSVEVYWQPRPAWKMTPGAGWRVARALARVAGQFGVHPRRPVPALNPPV